MPKRNRAEYLKRGYLIPETIQPETNISVCVPIPNDPNHIRAFLGQVDMLGYWWTWEREQTKSGTLAASVWRTVAEIIRSRIDNQEDCGMVQSCCVDTTVVLHRVNPETGKLEISTDGGTIWTTDPRDIGSTAIQLPPAVTSGAATDKCNAAANATNSVKQWVDEITAQKTLGVNLTDFLIAVALAVLAVFLELETVGAATALIIPIVLATAKLAFQMTTAEWSDYWTTTVYDDITCVFFCAMEDDGSITVAGYSEILFELADKLPSGDQKSALFDMLKARGIVGVNNMASIGTGTADCSGCECQTCFDSWLSYVPADTEAVSGTDEFGAYHQWTAVSTGIDYRVTVTNDGNFPSLIPSEQCCIPGPVRFKAFLTGTEDEAIISVYGHSCGDDDVTHHADSDMEEWWGAEILGNLSQGAYDLRLYL